MVSIQSKHHMAIAAAVAATADTSLHATCLSSSPTESSDCRSPSGLDSLSLCFALEDWMYWQRDSINHPNCWTKVYGVLKNEFLWLYQREESAPKSLLLQLAVAQIEESGTARQLRIVDPHGEDIELCLLDEESFEIWKDRLQEAAKMTDAFFRSSCVDPKDLPRNSFYRGTLISYRHVSKRDRCKAALSKLKKCVKEQLSAAVPES